MFHLTAPCPTGPNKAGRKERGYLSEDFEGPPRSLTVDASFRAFAQDTPVTSRSRDGPVCRSDATPFG